MFKFGVFCFFTLVLVLVTAQPHFLPLSGTGSCEAGRKYTITSIADLRNNIQDLECIFAAAHAPDAIGLGFHYGTVLKAENSVAAGLFAAPFYQGDYVVRTMCQKQEITLGTLKVAGISVGTAPWTLEPFTGPTAPNEAPLDPTIKNIVMDFRQNIHDICPIEELSAMLNSKGFLPFWNPPVPVNCFVDIARVVGRDASDGSIILLAKGLNNDPNNGWQTSLLYAMKNNDPAVKPGMAVGTELVVPASFTYVHNGFIPTVSRFGGQGLIPMLMNTKQTVNAALTSNPFVATLALKSGGFERSPLHMLESESADAQRGNPFLRNVLMNAEPTYAQPFAAGRSFQGTEVVDMEKPSEYLNELRGMMKTLISLEERRYALDRIDDD